MPHTWRQLALYACDYTALSLEEREEREEEGGGGGGEGPQRRKGEVASTFKAVEREVVRLTKMESFSASEMVLFVIGARLRERRRITHATHQYAKNDVHNRTEQDSTVQHRHSTVQHAVQYSSTQHSTDSTAHTVQYSTHTVQYSTRVQYSEPKKQRCANSMTRLPSKTQTKKKQSHLLWGYGIGRRGIARVDGLLELHMGRLADAFPHAVAVVGHCASVLVQATAHNHSARITDLRRTGGGRRRVERTDSD